MHKLPKLHKIYSSGAIIWGCVNPTEENILNMNNIDLSINTAVLSGHLFMVILVGFTKVEFLQIYDDLLKKL